MNFMHTKMQGLKRCGKSCRLRWLNYLRPDIKRGNISHDEEELIIRLHKLLGNRWSLIAGRLPGRTDNEIKNYWNTTLCKKANAQPSSPPSKQNSQRKSKAKSQPSEPKITKPSDSASSAATKTQVVRAKASRCTATVVIPTLSPPGETCTHKLNSSAATVDPLELQFRDQNNLVNNQPQDSAGSEMHCGAHEEQFHGTHSQGCDMLKFSYDCDGDNWENFNNLTMSTDELPFEEPIFNDFAVGRLEDDNADLSLESLAFLLECEEWPTDT
ncbi:hypothetical protein FEM48_Zijuj06G0058200 [Ziziphus jujuba var. spinosa]|uniref:Uncharacterized protein n=1 Tax=Ziziphus jujuba var. spinosa TaxID=714518 RepID=A0A978V7I8_ZIZJJ|nr:hypothetical protein FEM48_Zijuj06G0058200 [Ziziphus jujuba var. spinosa]